MEVVPYRRWKAVSALQHKFAKDDYGKSLACKVEHPAYSTGVRMATVVLDVLCECLETPFSNFTFSNCAFWKETNLFLTGSRESTDCVIQIVYVSRLIFAEETELLL